MAIVPGKTLYINNINEKVKTDVLKKVLYMMFSEYGRVRDIIAKKGLKLRGQAWVVFQDTSACTNALRGKQGFNFYGKPLKIQYSKSQSDTAAKLDGTFDIRLKRKRDEENVEKNEKIKKLNQSSSSDSENSNSKKSKIIVNSTPNRILFAQNLPIEYDETIFQSLFQELSGFIEVRRVPGNKKIAFIEFHNEIQSTLAMKQLHGFQLTLADTLNLTYGNL